MYVMLYLYVLKRGGIVGGGGTNITQFYTSIYEVYLLHSTITNLTNYFI